MNLLKSYVTNIRATYHSDHPVWGDVYEVICDTKCCLGERKNVRLFLSEKQYKSVQEKGYYLA